MSWIRIDDGMTDHPKIEALSDPAFRVWHRAVAYCSKNSTDGHIPTAAMRKLGARPKLIGELTTVLPPYEHPLIEVTPTGFLMHDYLEYQPSRADVLAKRKAATERKRSQRDKQKDERGDSDHTRSRSPEKNQDLSGSLTPHSGSGASDGDSPHGDKAVDGSLLDEVLVALSRLAPDVTVTPMHAKIVAEWVLDRAKKPPLYPTRYVKAAITRDSAQWVRFLVEGVLPE